MVSFPPAGDKRVRVCDPARSSRAGWPVQVEPGRAPQSAKSPLDSGLLTGIN